MSSEVDALANQYEARRHQLAHIARSLREDVERVLEGLHGIERVEFRVKATDSFVEKAVKLTTAGTRHYTHPLEEIEDQVGGRVMVFFRSTIDLVLPKLTERFAAVESERRNEKAANAFGYESHHFVFQIPPEVVPGGWTDREDRIETFELQVRTLFMHAWAELNHDVGYKKRPLTPDEERELAWTAASAWGADQGFQRIRDAIDERDGPARSPAHRGTRPERL